MKKHLNALDKTIRKELEKADDFTIEQGSRHYHIRINGKLVGVFTRRSKLESNRRAILNMITDIRRARREFAHA